MKVQRFVLTCLLLTLSSACFADSIKISGDTLDKVVVTETSDFYVVKNPADGSVQKISTKRADVGSITFSADRNTLFKEWETKRQQPPQQSAVAPNNAPSVAESGRRYGENNRNAAIVEKTVETTSTGTKKITLRGDPSMTAGSYSAPNMTDARAMRRAEVEQEKIDRAVAKQQLADEKAEREAEQQRLANDAANRASAEYQSELALQRDREWRYNQPTIVVEPYPVFLPGYHHDHHDALPPTQPPTQPHASPPVSSVGSTRSSGAAVATAPTSGTEDHRYHRR